MRRCRDGKVCPFCHEPLLPAEDQVKLAEEIMVRLKGQLYTLTSKARKFTAHRVCAIAKGWLDEPEPGSLLDSFEE